ncbi:MAG: GNAT family N-acetyltransferase [Bacteroidetes bacterium]|nr:GNAT family N-acetyltransferase [Bacteroidota bacterium]
MISLRLHFSPFPELTTDRLILRKIDERDVADIFDIRSNPEAMQYIDRPIAADENDALRLIRIITEGLEKNESITWGICMKDQPKLIGTIGFWRIQPEHFRAEIGYILHPDFHRLGIMQEAMQPVIDYAFDDMNLHSIEANINPANAASQKLLEKNHFVREAYFKENYFFNGHFTDTAIYSLLNSNH